MAKSTFVSVSTTIRAPTWICRAASTTPRTGRPPWRRGGFQDHHPGGRSGHQSRHGRRHTDLIGKGPGVTPWSSPIPATAPTSPDENGDETDGLDEALCPYDLQTKGEALTDDEIHALFAARKAGVKLVLISDSRHPAPSPGPPPQPAPRPGLLHAHGHVAAQGQPAQGTGRQGG